MNDWSGLDVILMHIIYLNAFLSNVGRCVIKKCCIRFSARLQCTSPTASRSLFSIAADRGMNSGLPSRFFFVHSITICFASKRTLGSSVSMHFRTILTNTSSRILELEWIPSHRKNLALESALDFTRGNGSNEWLRLMELDGRSTVLWWVDVSYKFEEISWLSSPLVPSSASRFIITSHNSLMLRCVLVVLFVSTLCSWCHYRHQYSRSC